MKIAMKTPLVQIIGSFMANAPILVVATTMNNKSLKAIMEGPTLRDKAFRALPNDGLISLHFFKKLILQENQSGEPFYVLDLGVVAQLMDNWTNSLPTVTPFYAVKCNPDPALLAALAALGSGFDCASRAEIEAVLALGVGPDRIILANPCKFESHIEYAGSVGVNLTTFDSLTEVGKIRKFHPRTALLVRIKAPEDGRARWPLEGKYGALPDEVEPLLRAAQAARLPVVGVSFHVGSGASNAGAYAGAIRAARTVFDAAAGLGMAPMRVLDIGGGFTAAQNFEEAASTIRATISRCFSDYEPGRLSVVAEPGRYFAETVFTLAARVIGKRVRGEEREYWINDGVYGSLLCSAVLEHQNFTCMGLRLRLSNNNNNNNEEEEEEVSYYSSTVFGPTCDAFDTVGKGLSLPELEMNDWVVFQNMGAYSSAVRSQFNGFHTKPLTTYLAYSSAIDKSAKLNYK